MKRVITVAVILSMIIISSCVKKDEENLYTIGLFQFSNSPYSIAVDGIVDALNEAGYKDGENCRFQFKNAQGDFSTAQSIAKKLVSDKVDLIITTTTPCLQITAAENKTIPHVFGAVTDPFVAGIGESVDDHQSNLTGIGTFQPINETIHMIKDIIPDLDNIGVVWNSSEACSEACTEVMREVTSEMGITLTEVMVSGSNEVFTAAQSLLAKKVDVIFVSGDNTVSSSLEAVISVADQGMIPVVTNTPTDTEKGALFSLGADYYTVGLETGKMAVRVIEGEKTSEMPIEKLIPKKLWINSTTADRLNITFPEEVIEKAGKVL